MAVIRAKQLPKTKHEFNALKLLAVLCYYYPQYTLRQARKLPYQHVKLLLQVAKEQKALDNLTLTQITAAPHTKKGSGVKKLTKHFKEQANG